MPDVSPIQLAIVLIIALVILGPKRLPDVGKSLGRGIREFKDSVSGNDVPRPLPAEPATTESGHGRPAAPEIPPPPTSARWQTVAATASSSDPRRPSHARPPRLAGTSRSSSSGHLDELRTRLIVVLSVLAVGVSLGVLAERRDPCVPAGPAAAGAADRSSWPPVHSTRS